MINVWLRYRALFASTVLFSVLLAAGMAAGAPNAFRVTSYEFENSEFASTTYTLTLNNDLEENYFVMIAGSQSVNAGRGPDDDCVRVTADAHGNFASSTAANQIDLARGGSDGDWRGVVTVVECLGGATEAGFTLKEVVEVTLALGSANALQQTDVALAEAHTANTVPFGGLRGGGGVYDQIDMTEYGVTRNARIQLTGTDNLKISRYGGGGDTPSAGTMTVYIVEWGSEWNVFPVHVENWTEGGTANDAIAEYKTGAIGATVTRSNTWVWGCSYVEADSLQNHGIVYTLGDGVNQSESESTVALSAWLGPGASRYSTVYVMEHAGLAVDYRYNGTADSYSPTIDAALGSETYDNASATVRYTEGYRFISASASCLGSGQAFSRALGWAGRITNDTQALVWRHYTGNNNAHWDQVVDFFNLEAPVSIWSDTATSNITFTSAWATATVNTNLDTCVLVWEETSTAPSEGVDTNEWSYHLSLGSTNGTVTAQMTNLEKGTNYTWRFYGANAETNGWSAADTFRYASLACSLEADMTTITALDDVVFTASVSGFNTNITYYAWDFGDGQSTNGANLAVVTNAYSVADSYTVSLTVSNALGESASYTSADYITVINGVVYMWTGAEDKVLTNAANWLVDGAVPAAAPASVSANNPETPTIDDVIVFDSTDPSFVQGMPVLYFRQKFGRFEVRNGTVAGQGDGNSTANASWSGTDTMVVGDGDNAVAAIMNSELLRLNGGTASGSPNYVKTYVIRSDGTLRNGQSATSVLTWSNDATQDTVMRILGGASIIDGYITETPLTGDDGDYVTFEAPGSTFTAGFGGVGQFPDIVSVRAHVGDGLSFRGTGGNRVAARDNGDGTFTIYVDNTAPTLADTDIADDKGGGPMDANTAVAYSLTFSEEMAVGSLTAAAFTNSAATTPSPYTFISMVQENATSYTVTIQPTAAGNLRLQVTTNVTDLAGNALPAAVDDLETLSVQDNTGDPPTITLDGGATFGASTATLRGLLTTGVSAEVYFCWDAAPDKGDVSTGAWANVVSVGTKGQDVPFSTALSGLELGSNYAYRCYAVNAAGSAWSEVYTFTTLATPIHTWTQQGVDPLDWEDPANWDAEGVPSQDVAGLHLIFSADTTGQICSTPDTAKVTVGAVTAQSSFDWRSFGSSGGGIFVDSGTNTPATFTLLNGASVLAYYTPWRLASDLELSGSGQLEIRGLGGNGVNGTGGFIIGSGTEIHFENTHLTSEYVYTGGVTIRSGGVADVNVSNGALGDGLVTIEEGGELQANNSLMDQAVLFVVTSDGADPAANAPLITGGGASLTFTGEFRFDVSAVTPIMSNQWTIVGATASYDAGFAVAGFTQSAGVWRANTNGAWYAFDPSTGVLAVIPEPLSAPEIVVEQPALNDLPSGSVVNFGSVALGSSNSLTFTIRNTGDADLTLDGTPVVAVSGAHASDFTVTAVPSTPVAAFGSTTFTVSFEPGESGTRSATLSIANNDSDEATFTIDVVGNNDIYTWIQGGDAADWVDPLNWQGGLIPVAAQTNASLIFSASTSGSVGVGLTTYRITLGSLAWSSSFVWNIGAWNESWPGITVDTGDASAATATVANSAVLDPSYARWLLNNDLALYGDGVLAIHAHGGSGVQGTGGFIVNSGTTLRFLPTYAGPWDYLYTGGVTIKSNGVVDVNSGMGALGDGPLTIDEGGELQAHNSAFDQDVTIVLASDGANPPVNAPLITGGGAALILSGSLSFNVDAVTPSPENQWQIISATASYGPTFSVGGAGEADGVWGFIKDEFVYRFDESTGVLSAHLRAASIFMFR